MKSIRIVCRPQPEEQLGKFIVDPIATMADVRVFAGEHELDAIESIRFEVSGNEPARAFVTFLNPEVDVDGLDGLEELRARLDDADRQLEELRRTHYTSREVVPSAAHPVPTLTVDSGASSRTTAFEVLTFVAYRTKPVMPGRDRRAPPPEAMGVDLAIDVDEKCARISPRVSSDIIAAAGRHAANLTLDVPGEVRLEGVRYWGGLGITFERLLLQGEVVEP